MSTEDDLFGDHQNRGFTLKEYLNKYFSYWPFFIVSISVCTGAGIAYSRYAIPKYRATTLLFVKGIENEGAKSSDIIETALSDKPDKPTSLDNQIQLLRSSSLMERVVDRNGFNISYYFLGKIRKVDVYLDAPFRLVPQFIGDSSKPLPLIVTNINQSGGIIKYGPEGKQSSSIFAWNRPTWVESKRFLLVPNVDVHAREGEYMVLWSPVKQAADELGGKLSLGILDPKTSIIQLGILIENQKRGVDVLNAVTREYNLTDIEDKITLSQNTIRFINERLDIVSRELEGVEGNLENYQASNSIANLPGQTSQSLGNSNETSKSISNVAVQQGVIQMIQSYFNNDNNEGKLVPSSLGIDDPTLSALISRYNELQITKEKEKPSLTSNGMVISELNNQINDIKGRILENLQNISKNLRLQENSFQQQNHQYREFLSSLPGKERVMQVIKRKQNLTEELYLYLLKKREEASISASYSNRSRYQQIDPAKGYGPVEPDTKKILIYSIIVGLLIPLCLISLGEMINDKVRGRKDLEMKMPEIPIIGELVHMPKNKIKGVAVIGRELISEQFRIIRTTLLSILRGKDKQVIIVTSTSKGEGKSFISLNFAAVLAIPGKKVALLDFDLRNSSVLTNLNINKDKGLIDYITGKTTNLTEIYQVIEGIPSLHVYLGGKVPINPADILISETVPQLFKELKSRYDYVIIDSAPAGLVSDAFILSEYCNAVLYIVRQQHTLKKQLNFIKDIYETGKLSNISLIINDVKAGGKYGYGYGRIDDYGDASLSNGNGKRQVFWKRRLAAKRG